MTLLILCFLILLAGGALGGYYVYNQRQLGNLKNRQTIEAGTPHELPASSFPFNPPRLGAGTAAKPARKPSGFPSFVWNQNTPEAEEIGVGGEAKVYKWNKDGRKVAMKIYFRPEHLKFKGDDLISKMNRSAAELRLKEYPAKIPMFPVGLPSTVVTPEFLVFSDSWRSQFAGIGMRFVESDYGLDKLLNSRDPNRVKLEDRDIAKIFLSLHETVRALHAAGVVIGDFKAQNVLIKNGVPHIVDMESAEYGGFRCHAYTADLVDPRICDPTVDFPKKEGEYSRMTDWYAFNALLFWALVGASPWGGIYLPKGEACQPGQRAQKRIWFYHPDVKRDMSLRKSGSLPKKLKEYFKKVFEQDLREEFPIGLLYELMGEFEPIGANQAAGWPDLIPLTATPQEVLLSHAAGQDLTFSQEGAKVLATGVWDDGLHQLYSFNGKVALDEDLLLTDYNGEFDTFDISRLGTVVAKTENNRVRGFLLGPDDRPLKFEPDISVNGPLFDLGDHELLHVRQGKLFRYRSGWKDHREVSEFASVKLLKCFANGFSVVVSESTGSVSTRLLNEDGKVIPCQHFPSISGIQDIQAFAGEEDVLLVVTSQENSSTKWISLVLYSLDGRVKSYGRTTDSDAAFSCAARAIVETSDLGPLLVTLQPNKGFYMFSLRELTMEKTVLNARLYFPWAIPTGEIPVRMMALRNEVFVETSSAIYRFPLRPEAFPPAAIYGDLDVNETSEPVQQVQASLEVQS